MPGCCANPVFTAVQRGPGSRIGQHINTTRKPTVRHSTVGRGPESNVGATSNVQGEGSGVQNWGSRSRIRSPGSGVQGPWIACHSHRRVPIDSNAAGCSEQRSVRRWGVVALKDDRQPR